MVSQVAKGGDPVKDAIRVGMRCKINSIRKCLSYTFVPYTVVTKNLVILIDTIGMIIAKGIRARKMYSRVKNHNLYCVYTRLGMAWYIHADLPFTPTVTVPSRMT